MDTEESEKEAMVTISCSEHYHTLVGGLWNFFTNQHDVDHELELDGSSVLAHHLILEVFLSSDKLARLSINDDQSTTVHGSPDASRVEPSRLQPEMVNSSRAGSEMGFHEVVVETSRMMDELTSRMQQPEVTTATPAQTRQELAFQEMDMLRMDEVLVSRTTADCDQRAPEMDNETGSSCLYTLLQFLYTGRVTVPRKQLSALLRTAERLDFHMLARAVRSVVPVQEEGNGSVGRRPEAGLTQGGVKQDLPVEIGSGRMEEEEVMNSDELFELDSEWDLSDSGDNSQGDDGSEGSDWLQDSRTGKGNTEGRRRKPGRRPAVINTTTTSNTAVTESVEAPPTTASAATVAKRRGRSSVAERRATRTNKRSKRTATTTSSSSSRIYRCDRCDFSASGSWKYRHHLNTVHGVTTRGEPFQQLRCPDCSYTAIDRNQLKYHAVRHSTDKPFKCAHCPYASGLKGCIVRHTAIVHPDTLPGSAVEPPRLLKCPHCDRFQTYKKRTYDHHLYSVHRLRTNGEPLPGPHYTCDECGFECVNASILKNHHLTKHSGQKPFRCPHCSYATSRKGRLGQHVRQVHLGLKPFMCEICGHKAPSAVKLEQHLQVHCETRPYVCELCSQTYKDQGSFKRHVRRHTSDERHHVCHMCSRAFNRLSNLKVHLRNVHKQIGNSSGGADGSAPPIAPALQ